ncbi:MAG: beta-L-arabinofuranosidase domain-containing protein [Clostridia bacterium]
MNWNYVGFSQIKPMGFLKNYMQRDLDGFIGHLDELLPTLIVEDDIYHLNRRGTGDASPELGLVEIVPGQDDQFAWWNSETQGNWLDGLVRTAVMLESEESLKKALFYLTRILNGQTADGYIGIYKPDLRFKTGRENGELWAQTTALRALLFYYEYSKDAELFQRIKNAIRLTMQAFPIGNSTPFDLSLDTSLFTCGTEHGLTYVDLMETMHRLTGEKEYLDYAVFLYAAFNSVKVSNDDVQIMNLINQDYRFKQHGVHTYEHLRALTMAAFASSNPENEKALSCYCQKLPNYLTPAGGPIGDECVWEHYGDPTKYGYEYCSLQELLHSYTLLLQRTGDLVWADKIEWLLFNAAMGAHHPTASAITYLNSDNVYSLQGSFQQEQDYTVYENQTRYKYSPTHQDVAVCCVPNAGRILPYYLQSMWLRENTTYTKVLYGDSIFTTSVNETPVTISEQSNYPFGNVLQFIVATERPVEFTLAFRIPSWCTSISSSLPFQQENDKLIFSKIWQEQEAFELSFNYVIKENIDIIGDVYYSYGPLVYGLSLPSQEKIVRTYADSELKDSHILPLVSTNIDYSALTSSLVNATYENGNISLELFNNQKMLTENVNLIPMQKCSLRRITFPLKGVSK